jgi:hypothetical protein
MRVNSKHAATKRYNPTLVRVIQHLLTELVRLTGGTCPSTDGFLKKRIKDKG